MSNLSYELKRQALRKIRANLRKTGNSGAIQVFVNDMGDPIPSGSGTNAKLTLTVTGMQVPADVMENIARAYLQENATYYTDVPIIEVDTTHLEGVVRELLEG